VSRIAHETEEIDGARPRPRAAAYFAPPIPHMGISASSCPMDEVTYRHFAPNVTVWGHKAKFCA